MKHDINNDLVYFLVLRQDERKSNRHWRNRRGDYPLHVTICTANSHPRLCLKLLKLSGIDAQNIEDHPSRDDFWRGTTTQTEAEVPITSLAATPTRETPTTKRPYSSPCLVDWLSAFTAGTLVTGPTSAKRPKTYVFPGSRREKSRKEEVKKEEELRNKSMEMHREDRETEMKRKTRRSHKESTTRS